MGLNSTRIDLLVGKHTQKLSETLQPHRAQLFPPDARKELRKFTSGEVASLFGVNDPYLRKLHLDGKGPSPEIRKGGRRYYSTGNIQALRSYLETGARVPGTYMKGRRGGDHLQVISVINFKGGSGKTTTSAHLVQKLALEGYRVLGIDLDPQASFSALHGSIAENGFQLCHARIVRVRFSDIPQVEVLPPTLLLFCAPIKPLGPVVPLFGHLPRELSAISGLGGEVDPDIGLIDPRMGRPVEPLLFRFYR